MGRRHYWPEEIISKIREAEVLLAEGMTVAQMANSLGGTEQTYYRWRKQYGGMKISQMKRLKDLEQENARLRKAASDLNLDKVILQETAKGHF